MSILHQLDGAEKVRISKGYSPEKKYRLSGDHLYFLKQSPPSFVNQKRLETTYLKNLSSKTARWSKLLDLKVNSDRIDSLYEWIDGVDFRDLAPSMSDQTLYYYGHRAGQFLKELHSLPIAEEVPDWYKAYNAKIDRKIAAFNEVRALYPDGKLFIEFIDKKRDLLQIRPQTLCHGDYHVGNMMIERSSQDLWIIDFGSLEIGDPYEEFNRMIWNAQISEEFATGMINGYFDQEIIPEQFWGLMALYMATDVIGSISWAIPYGEKQVQTMIQRADDVFNWYQGFETLIPSFYKTKD
ncbi:aminoglycoside phosphotransferase (APT) family kinase protein [Streptococcus rupicaprae]|uniref:Aminoglycoside phosphotransferase (APT) family kinase protein n=1 Tax=Streptococcus rupicaprae TaxID=759619 RepID=A0ABV2FH85_9STRE